MALKLEPEFDTLKHYSLDIVYGVKIVKANDVIPNFILFLTNQNRPVFIRMAFALNINGRNIKSTRANSSEGYLKGGI